MFCLFINPQLNMGSFKNCCRLHLYFSLRKIIGMGIGESSLISHCRYFDEYQVSIVSNSSQKLHLTNLPLIYKKNTKRVTIPLAACFHPLWLSTGSTVIIPMDGKPKHDYSAASIEM